MKVTTFLCCKIFAKNSYENVDSSWNSTWKKERENIYLARQKRVKETCRKFQVKTQTVDGKSGKAKAA
jgi:hypothetical protein